MSESITVNVNNLNKNCKNVLYLLESAIIFNTVKRKGTILGKGLVQRCLYF